MSKNENLVYNSRVYWKDSQFAEYLRDSGVVESNEEENLLFLINKENETKEEHQLPQTKSTRIISNIKLSILKMSKKIYETLFKIGNSEFWLPLSTYASDKRFLKLCLKDNYDTALKLNYRGRDILFSFYAGVFIVVFLFAFQFFSFGQTLNFAILYFGIGFALLKLKQQSLRNNIIQLVKFVSDSQSIQLEERISKILRFLREFEIVQSGQRIGIKKDSLFQQKTQASITDAILFSRINFLDLRKSVKEGAQNCIENLFEILRKLNEKKFTALKQSHIKIDELSTKELQNHLEDYASLKEEIKIELIIFLETLQVNSIQKNKILAISKLLSSFVDEKSKTIQKIDSIFKQSKLQYQSEEVETERKNMSQVDNKKSNPELKHIPSLILIQNNHKTMKRHIQTIILKIKQLQTSENKNNEASIEILKELKNIMKYEEEFTKWHTNIYSMILLDLSRLLTNKKDGGLDHEGSENASQSNDEHIFNEDIIYHDEDDELKKAEKELIAKIYEIEPNFDKTIERNEVSQHKLDEERKYAVSMNSVIDELKDSLPVKKKTYNMQKFKQDKNGAFKLAPDAEKITLKEDSIESNSQSNNLEKEFSIDKKEQKYSISSAGMPFDFRQNLLSELKNRQTQIKNKEDSLPK